MKFLIFGLLGFFVVIAKAKVEYAQTALDCITEINTDEDTMRTILDEHKLFPEDNELALKFFECVYRTNVNDDNEMILDEKLTNRVRDILTKRLDGKEKLAALMADDCIEHCKDRKGDTKGKTIVKVVNCIRERTWELLDEKH